MSRPHGILKLAHLPHRDISVGFDPILAINVSSWTAFKTDVVTKTDAKRGLLETLNNAEGEVSDGYIKNANGQVINVATNAVIERFITNNDGSYQLTTSTDSLPDIIKILVEPGGTDISTNTTHTSELTAIVIKNDLTSSNKVSINPITSMVVSIAEENSTVDATAITNAKSDVKQAFGITDAQLNKDYIKENDNTLAVITAQLETLASTLEDTVGTLTTLSKTQVNTSIAKVLKERSEETAFNLSNSSNIESIVNKIKTVHNIPDSDDFTNIKTNAKTYISTINTSINNVTGTFTQRITEATKIKIASSNKITTVKETFKTDSFDSAAVVSDVNTAKAEVTIQTIQAPTRSLISVPGAPTNLSITPGSYSASASWTAPSDTGGATISGYKLEYIELSRKVPSSPSGLTASVSVDDATLNWTAPADDGNSPILEYTVNYKADAVSVYCYNHGYMGGEYLISGSSDDYSDATVLTNNTVVNVVSTDSGNRYTFNGETTYHENNSYKITGNGTYTFQNVPSGHPIAILNNGISNITYTGDADKKSTKAVTGTTNDGTYDFYHGDVTVTVSGGADFSYYASNTAINTGSVNTTHVITNLPMAVKYFFSVGGNNDIGVGTVTETSSSYLAATFPGQPTNLSADIVKTSATSVLLTWSEPNDGGEPIDSYTAEYSLGPAYSSWVVFNPDPDSTPVDFNKEITGLQSGKLYKFRIRGVNAIGNGLYSDEVTGSPGRYAIDPVFPTMSSNGILTTYIHSSYFYRVYTFTTAYSSGYVLEAGGSGTENPNTLRPVHTTSDHASGSTYSSNVHNGLSSERAFNGTTSNDGDCFHSINHNPVEPNDPAWIAIKFPGTTTKKITKYKLWTRIDTHSPWQPVDWEIRGVATGITYTGNSTSSSNYTVLHTVTGETTWERSNSNSVANDTERKEFEITTPGYYNTYVINITNSRKTNSNSDGHYAIIGQWALYSTTLTGESFTLSGSVSQKFDIFMIGGGGSGGTTWAGGGGGAGSAVLAKDWSISPATYDILVGGGGAAITDTTAKGNDGSPTSFGSLFATKGGGGGGTGSSSISTGNEGGSGGGSSNYTSASNGGASKFETASATIDLDSASATKYYKNDPTTYNLSSSQNVTIYGNDGGSSVISSGSSQDFGAGGGGIGAAGSNATTSSGGAGGAGLANDYRYGPSSGTTDLKQDGSALSHPGIQYYGGGGGGGGDTNTATAGGSSVGGTGVKNGTDAGDAVANTGSGGGGGSNTITNTNPTISNPSFENHDYTGSAYYYITMPSSAPYTNNTSLTGWTAGRSLTNGGVVIGYNGNGAWGSLNSGVGNWYIILQRRGAYVEQTINVTQGGNYKVTLKGAQRPNGGKADNILIKIDGTTITTINSSYSPGLNTTFKDFESSNFTASSNSVTLRLECHHTNDNDHAIFIDDIAMISTSSPSISGSGSTGIVTVRQLLGVVGVPFSPTNVSGTAANAQSVVSWTVPNWDGNYAITGYKVEYAAGSSYSSWTVAVASTSSSPYTVTGLTNGTNYKFRVSAINSQGTGAASTPSSAVAPTAFSATGGTITTYTLSSVNYKVHTFLYDENNDTNGQTTYTFTVTGSKDMDFLIVAGGGSGGGDNGGGGGAGGVLYYGQETPNNGAQRQIPAGNHTVKVGKGGLARQGSYGQVTAGVTNDGYNSSITIGEDSYVAIGGGAGGVGDNNKTAGRQGGSGGGGGGERSGGDGGVGVSEQGNAGGNSATGSTGGGGGGGAGAVGDDHRTDGTKLGGDGGIGVEYNIRTGTNQWYAAGGTAGGDNNRHSTRSPISGIGGIPPTNNNTPATSGQNETGSGGGGYTYSAPDVNGYYGGHGGTGIVVIRYVV